MKYQNKSVAKGLPSSEAKIQTVATSIIHIPDSNRINSGYTFRVKSNVENH